MHGNGQVPLLHHQGQALEEGLHDWLAAEAAATLSIASANLVINCALTIS